MFIAALFITVPSWKQLKRSSASEWINTVWFIHAMENYLAMKGGKILIHITT